MELCAIGSQKTKTNTVYIQCITILLLGVFFSLENLIWEKLSAFFCNYWWFITPFNAPLKIMF